MKPTYSNIKFTEGLYTAGHYLIQIVPREWLLDAIIPDFNTGKVIDEILLQDGRAWLNLECVPDTYEFDEKPKSNRGGSYFEVTVQGTINNITPELLAALETMRHHEIVAVLKDKQRQLKVVGNIDTGMVFRFANKEDSSKQGGMQVCAIDMVMDSDTATPFYEI